MKEFELETDEETLAAIEAAEAERFAAEASTYFLRLLDETKVKMDTK